MINLIKINDQEILFGKNTLRIDDAIDERTTCRFDVIDMDGTQSYRKGQNVEVYNNGVLIFAGVVETAKEIVIAQNGAKSHQINAVDWHYLADKRIIAKAYQNQTVGYIVRDIVENYLADEGVTIDFIAHHTFLSTDQPVSYPFQSTVDDGQLLTEAVFNYSRVSDALDTLAEKAGYWWRIDENKKLYFVARTAFKAPFVATNNIMLKGSIAVDKGNPEYRNTQYIRGVKDVTDPQTEISVGDGDKKAFVVGYPIAKVPTIEVNLNGAGWVAQTVGIRGLDGGRNWYWSKSSNTVSQDDSATPLAKDVDKIRIVYQGEFDVVIKSRLQDEIDGLSTIDGTTGIVEDVADEPSASGRSAGFESANAKLKKFSIDGKKVSFKTWKKGLVIGQLLTVNLPQYGIIDEEFLIEAIAISKEDNKYYYDVRAVLGIGNQSWTKFFYAMATRGQTFVIRENISEDQILTTLEEFTKIWEASDSPNIFKQVYAAADLFPSDTLFPTFEQDERVDYFAWYSGATELGRKAVTKQTDNLKTTVILSPLEANATITHVGWWGGIKATSAIGTGVEVDKQAYDKVKTQLEAIQIDKTDTINFLPSTGTLLLTARHFQTIDDSIEQLLINSA